MSEAPISRYPDGSPMDLEALDYRPLVDLIRQRADDDCTICSIAMATGLSYEAVMATARHAVGGYRYRGKPGTMSVVGVLKDLGFDAKRTPLAGVPGSVWKRLLWRRPAVLSVASLNGFDGHHDVLWDGEAIRDPGLKATYASDADVQPIWATVFSQDQTTPQNLERDGSGTIPLPTGGDELEDLERIARTARETGNLCDEWETTITPEVVLSLISQLRGGGKGEEEGGSYRCSGENSSSRAFGREKEREGDR